MRIWNRIRCYSMRPRLDQELMNELRVHQEMLEEQFVREGMSASDARFAVRRQFGSKANSMDESRDEWGYRWLDSLIRDAKFAIRLIRKQPMLALAAVLTVGLGVGANTAIVSVLQTALLNPLGLRDAAKVMVATVRFDKLQMRQAPDSGVEFRELKAMSDAFSAVSAVEGRARMSEVNGEPSRLLGRAVTPDFFRVFGVQPLAGRFFGTADRESVVLSHRLWQAQFGGSFSAIGRVMMLDGQPHRVVGVAPAGFRFPTDALVWTPLVLEPKRLQQRGENMNLDVFARLKDGMTQMRAAARVNRYVAAIKSPATGDGGELTKLGYFIDLDSFSHYVSGDLRRPLWLLWGAALVVLLTGCANVAALLLSRTASRKREVAIRLALGATRFQIVRQLLIESLLLGFLGGLCGIAVAGAGISLLTQLSIPGKDLLQLVALDYRLMLYGLVLSLASGLLFGLAPAVQLLRESQSAAMTRGGRRRFQDVFIVAEVAAALVLLIGTGLLLRSFWAIERVRPGFDPNHVSTAYFIKPQNDAGFIGRLDSTLLSSPGVQAAALAYPLPFSGGGLTSMFTIKGRNLQVGEPVWHGEAYFVSPTYFETLRIPLIRGRVFSHADTSDAPFVCVIDMKLAQRFFPNQDSVGQDLAMYKGYARIVGVVGSIRDTTLDQGSRPVVYYPLAQVPFFPQAAVLVRPRLPGAPVIREAVRKANSSVPVYDIRTMEDRIAESLGIRRVLAILVSVFGGLCLLLATVGLYGVVSQVVGERAPEIGLRMALGAQPAQIMGHFLRRGLLSGLAGAAIGLGVAVYGQRWLTDLLYEVKPLDIPTFCSACLGLMLVLLLAVFWPARRASRIDPQTVLKYE
jgi:predicted permease